MSSSNASISILGTRGIPAQHGGFETFAEKLAFYLVQQGWNVTVYCQVTGDGPIVEEIWNDIRLVKISVPKDNAFNTIKFDWHSMRHAVREPGNILTLGYNTAFLSIYCLLRRKKQFINMDGIEWKRKKWSLPIKGWFYLNEKLGSLMGSELIADHPEIAKHLKTMFTRKKIRMIPYGADHIANADRSIIDNYHLRENNYALLIARPEPENSILEVVTAFSQHNRGIKLLVLGDYNEAENKYHKQVRQAASDEVMFLGAIYDKSTIAALRYYCKFYIHGHQVGGTNPALVEALGAGCAVLARTNKFNSWVAADGAVYFSDVTSCSEQITVLLENQHLIDMLKANSNRIFQERFRWDTILQQYETLLLQYTYAFVSNS